MTDKSLAVFENFTIRRYYDEQTEIWYFSVVDIIQALIQQPDYQNARKYWNKLKERLKKEGSQSVTNCHRLKMEAADGKKYLTDAANAETLLHLTAKKHKRINQKTEHDASEYNMELSCCFVTQSLYGIECQIFFMFMIHKVPI